MPDEVILDVTTIEENVTVETTAGDVVEVKVVATQGAAATVTVGTTTTGAAGSSASVTNSGTTSAAVFNFTIPRGDTGAAGASGGSSTAWRYRAKTNATSGYPTNGHLLWDNATQLSATEILVSHLDDEGSDIEFFLSFFLEGQKIFIQNRDDSSQNQVWEITGTPTVTGANTSTAYYTFPVTLVSSAGAPFTNNHSILFGSIAAAVNAVTSATTSDYTAELNLAQVNTGVLVVTDGVTIETLDYNFGTGSAQALKDALEIASADITDATSDGDANKEKVLKTDSQGSLTVTNAFGVNASFGSSLVVGDGDSVNGRYDIFNNSSHLQWYSDSAPYGEREFVITTQNLTSSGSWGYKYPAASGTFAVTASTTGVPDKLTDGTIAGTLALNSTSYTYGIGAAATHRTALGLTTLATTTPAANVATFLETPTSSNLAAAVTGETGSGALVFGTSPTIVAPTISGSAAFTSTTRPTSAGTGAPEATSLMTRDDSDARSVSTILGTNFTVNNSATRADTDMVLSLEIGTWELNGFFQTQNAATGGAKIYIAVVGVQPESYQHRLTMISVNSGASNPIFSGSTPAYGSGTTPFVFSRTVASGPGSTFQLLPSVIVLTAPATFTIGFSQDTAVASDTILYAFSRFWANRISH